VVGAPGVDERAPEARRDRAHQHRARDREHEERGEDGRGRREPARGQVGRTEGQPAPNASGWMAAASARAASGTRGPARKIASPAKATTRPSRTAGTVARPAKRSCRPCSVPIAASTITSGARATTSSSEIWGQMPPASAATLTPPAADTSSSWSVPRPATTSGVCPPTRNPRRGRGVVALRADADQAIPRAEGVDDLGDRRGERDDACGWRGRGRRRPAAARGEQGEHHEERRAAHAGTLPEPYPHFTFPRVAS